MANQQNKNSKKWIWLTLVVVAAGIGGYILLIPPATAQYAQAAAVVGDISTRYSFTGNITAPHSQTITAPEAATVKDVYTAANGTVQSGDRLLRLSTGEIIKADIAGEVIRLNVRKGDVVASGEELLVIMDVTRLEVKITIDEYDVGAVVLGKPVDITVNALGLHCDGVIQSLDKDADTGNNLATYTAVVSMDAPQGVLPGMQVEVTVVAQSAENVLLLRMDALQFDETNRAYVLTKTSEDTYAKTYVETGISDGVNVQIVSGLQNGNAAYYTANGPAASTDASMSSFGGGNRGLSNGGEAQ